eukprot:TRINITY_DN5189_c0_g1_i1.p1 TRINITY_DN5189_c0_g1~~TRINITY_DN5189_c0_g1_i1.p1  ORF type:complete len:763 (+),score=245.59 TRINITY_DN5189_c0_g1_i1:62-2350(+)
MLPAATLAAAAAAAPGLSVRVSADASFEVSVGGAKWLASGAPRVRADGAWRAAGAGMRLTATKVSSGSDKLGAHNTTTATYTVAGSGAVVEFSVADYTAGGVPAALLRTTFVTGLNGTVSDQDSVSSAFPSFAVDGPADRAFLTWWNQMVGGMYDGWQAGPWSNTTDTVKGGAMGGGPVVVFDGQQTTVLSPWEQFMTSSSAFNKTARVVDFGLLGTVESVPAGYSLCSAIYQGADITAAVKEFGTALLDWHGKDTTQFPSGGQHVSVNQLGYYTDNGAYYHDVAPLWPDNYEKAMLAVKADSAAKGIPFKYLQLDSWWYVKGTGGGIRTWTAPESKFPHGLPSLYSHTEWPVVAHSKYYSSDNVYSKKNGGKYDFVSNGGYEMPVDADFWVDMFANSSGWGLSVFEHDWLHNEWENIPAARASATIPGMWLSQMGAGAAAAGLKIQYCMAYPRFAMASAAIPAVNQIRVSDDYRVDVTSKYDRPVNLYTGASSLLAWALNLAPSKDTFWSTPKQAGYRDGHEAQPAAHAAVATLTCGPVGPGDKAGNSNATLIATTCMANGTLLQPTRPATPTDDYFLQVALGGGRGPEGELYVTESVVGAAGWGQLIAMDLRQDYAQKVWPQLAKANGGAAEYVGVGSPLFSPSAVVPVSSAAPLKVSASALPSFGLYVLAPVHRHAGGSIAFLGELAAKIVPVAPARFRSIVAEPWGYAVAAVGQPGEKLVIFFATSANQGATFELGNVTCVVGAAGSVHAALPNSTCS